MADDYKSLLGRSSGSSFADIASAYITGNRKSDNRARNVLLASLFFNAKEANMQAKVVKNLKELEKNKDLEVAKLNAQWDKRTKLQTEYDQLQKNGALVYFEDKLDRDFENTHKQHKDIMNLSSNEIETYKLNWKKTEAEKYQKDLEDRYKGVDRGITVKEEFQKPYMDYYDGQKEKILNPSNTSLVHKMFSKIGMGTEAPNLQKIKENFVNDQTRIKTFTQKEAQAIKNLVPVREDILGLKINQKDFSTLLSESVYLAENPQARARAANQFSNSNQTASKAQDIILQLQLNSEILSSEFKFAQMKNDYIELQGPRPSVGGRATPEMVNRQIKWDDGFDRFKRVKMGVSDVSDTIINNVEGLQRLALDNNISVPDKKEMIENMVDETVRKSTGEVNYKLLGAQFTKEAMFGFSKDLERGEYALPVSQTMFDEVALKQLEKEAPKAFNLLKDLNYDVIKFNDNVNALEPEELRRVRKIQKDLYTQAYTDTMFGIGRILGSYDPNT